MPQSRGQSPLTPEWCAHRRNRQPESHFEPTQRERKQSKERREKNDFAARHQTQPSRVAAPRRQAWREHFLIAAAAHADRRAEVTHKTAAGTQRDLNLIRVRSRRRAHRPPHTPRESPLRARCAAHAAVASCELESTRRTGGQTAYGARWHADSSNVRAFGAASVCVRRRRIRAACSQHAACARRCLRLRTEGPQCDAIGDTRRRLEAHSSTDARERQTRRTSASNQS
jgi:hypothetical protein